MLPTIAREADAVVMIDQRKLPAEEVYVRCKTASEVARAIKTMVIRGAPAIGVAAAMGIALGMRKSKATGTQKFAAELQKLCDLMAGTRPTAPGSAATHCETAIIQTIPSSISRQNTPSNPNGIASRPNRPAGMTSPDTTGIASRFASTP